MFLFSFFSKRKVPLFLAFFDLNFSEKKEKNEKKRKTQKKIENKKMSIITTIYSFHFVFVEVSVEFQQKQI